MLKLYYDPMSCAPASRMALEEAGADYELIHVDLKSGQQRTPEYLAVNPKGRVPALKTPEGILTENPAIMFYVARMFPAAQLAPLDDTWALSRMMAFNAFLSSSVHVAFAHIGRASRWADTIEAQEAMKAKAPSVVHEQFKVVDGELENGPWILGSAFSIADIYLCNFSRAARQYDWFTSLDRVRRHLDRMMERPSYAVVYGPS